MATWSFAIGDNGGKRQYFKVKASSKPEAIEKGMARAKKNAKGDLSCSWECKLIVA